MQFLFVCLASQPTGCLQPSLRNCKRFVLGSLDILRMLAFPMPVVKVDMQRITLHLSRSGCIESQWSASAVALKANNEKVGQEGWVRAK